MKRVEWISGRSVYYLGLFGKSFWGRVCDWDERVIAQSILIMSSVPPPNPPSDNNEKKPETNTSAPTPATAENAAMDTTPDAAPPPETWDDIPEEILSLSTDEVLTRIRLIENDIKVSSMCSRDFAYIHDI